MDQHDGETPSAETVEAFRSSFSYGSRGDLNFKFAKSLSDAQFGDFLQELFATVSAAYDSTDSTAAVGNIVEAARRWQVQAHAGNAGDPSDHRFHYDDVPLAPLSKPLADSKLAVITSSGQFVEGDDPNPFGVENMTQAEAVARISEFVKEAPTLSSIPVDTPSENIRVRHGGFPVEAVAADPQVALPLTHLQAAVADGRLGALNDTAYAFVGASSQLRLKRDVAPAWAEMLKAQGTDAALLVPN